MMSGKTNYGFQDDKENCEKLSAKKHGNVLQSQNSLYALCLDEINETPKPIDNVSRPR